MEPNTTEMTESDADEFAEMVSELDAGESVGLTNQIEVSITKNEIDKFLHKMITKGIKRELITKPLIVELHEHGIHTTITHFHKYTVVELVFAGCRHHGLASMHHGDEPNDLTGIGLAYSRAFDQLLAKHQKNTKRSQQSTILGRIELTIAGN